MLALLSMILNVMMDNKLGETDFDPARLFIIVVIGDILLERIKRLFKLTTLVYKMINAHNFSYIICALIVTNTLTVHLQK